MYLLTTHCPFQTLTNVPVLLARTRPPVLTLWMVTTAPVLPDGMKHTVIPVMPLWWRYSRAMTSQDIGKLAFCSTAFFRLTWKKTSKSLIISPLWKVDSNAKANRQWGQVGWILAYHRDRLTNSSLFLIIDCSIGLWVGIQSAGDLLSLTSELHSAEEGNLLAVD